MPTNEERREVAAWIRNGAHDIDINGYIKLAINVVDRGDGATWGQLALKLADLIEPEPERTCENESSKPGIFTCSYCGADFYDAEISGDWNYCPNCGAKVVENEVTPTPL